MTLFSLSAAATESIITALIVAPVASWLTWRLTGGPKKDAKAADTAAFAEERQAMDTLFKEQRAYNEELKAQVAALKTEVAEFKALTDKQNEQYEAQATIIVRYERFLAHYAKLLEEHGIEAPPLPDKDIGAPSPPLLGRKGGRKETS